MNRAAIHEQPAPDPGQSTPPRPLQTARYADPNTAISYRDAQARAASIDDEQTALRLLNRAELSGDTSLAKAVAARAIEAGWNVAINQYADSNPTSEAKFNELTEIESYGKGSAGFAQILGTAMSYSVEKPSACTTSTHRFRPSQTRTAKG